jgi:hypothetical protein
VKAQAVDPDAARDAAKHILSDRRFRHDPAPRPLRGPLEWLGDRLRGIVNWISDVLSHVPTALVIAIVVAIVVAVIAYIVSVVRRRRVTAKPPAGDVRPRTADDSEDARALERAADEAERDGDLERALRLRFRAGLLRLGDRGAIAYRPSVTTGEVRRALGSETFDELAQTFEEVTYGDRVAQKPDVDSARQEWPRVVEQAARK